MTAAPAARGLTEVVRWSEGDPQGALPRALAVLRAGGVAAHPTETVYGLAAAGEDERGFRELLRLKGGSSPRVFLLLFAERRALEERLGALPPGGNELAQAFWPGPLTLLIPARTGLPRWWIGPQGQVAARVTSHAFARALVRGIGQALLSTSANPAGAETPVDAGGVAHVFSGRGLELVVDGGRAEGLPSTLLRWSEPEWSIERHGSLPAEDVLRVASR